ncbi:MAG TPA: hypothetical protein VN327_13875, partial [Pseudonocardiaceae bacterium]|nr:hypothetical protein [Pseudonocardiaceae bacterium]
MLVAAVNLGHVGAAVAHCLGQRRPGQPAEIAPAAELGDEHILPGRGAWACLHLDHFPFSFLLIVNVHAGTVSEFSPYPHAA